MANQKTYIRRKKEKEEEEEENSEMSNQIDLIPKCVQQPRTRSPGGPKRRTDFSLFFCSQFSPPCSSIRDFSPESHASKDGLSEAKHDVLQGSSKVPSFHLILCCQSQHEGERFSPEYPDLRGKEAESSSNAYEQKGDTERTMESTPEILCHSVSKDISQASLGGERLTRSDSDNASINGHASVQCCGTDESVLLQSGKSSSRFQDGFLRRGDIKSSKKLARHSAEPDYSDENDQPFGKLKSSSSSKIEGDTLVGGRGKRKRKPKVHFDELANPEESVTKSRRLKIMRHLGLSAPAYSPFILPHH